MQHQQSTDANRSHIILWFLNFDFPHDEITAKLDLQPTRIVTKGQEQATSVGTKKISRHTFWEYEWRSQGNEFIGDIVEQFVEQIIKPRVQRIRALATQIDAEFKIVQYYYDGFNPGYHFTKETLQTLIDASLEMDIETYCLCEEKASS